MSKIHGSSSNIEAFSPISAKAGKLLDATVAPPKAAAILGLKENTPVSHRATAETPAHSSGIGDRIKSAFQSFGATVANLARSGLGALRDLVAREPRAQTPVATDTNAPAPEREKVRTLPGAPLNLGNITAISVANLVVAHPAPKNDPDPTTYRMAVVDANLTKLFDSIEKGVTADKDSATLTNETLEKAVTVLEAGKSWNTNTAELRGMADAFEAKGEPAKAAFMHGLADRIDLGRTPDGARSLFLPTALTVATSTKDLGNFLRLTTDADAACIKKLMNANGAQAAQGTIASQINAAFDRSGGDALVASFKKHASGPGGLKAANLPPELIGQLKDMTLAVLDAALEVPVPDGMSKTLEDIATEIGADHKEKDTDTIGKRHPDAASRQHKLFSDQTILKHVCATTTTIAEIIRPMAGSNLTAEQVAANERAAPLSVVMDMINTTANMIAPDRKAEKWSPSVIALYSELRPLIHERLETYYVANGMPESATVSL